MKIKIDKRAVGLRIKQIRLNKGYTLKEFGKIFDTSDSIVYRWEQGTALPNKERIKQITKFADITVNELLYGSVEEFVNNNSNLLLYQDDPLKIMVSEIPTEQLLKNFIREIKSKQYTVEDVDKIINYSQSKNNFSDEFKDLKNTDYIVWAYEFLDDTAKKEIIEIMLNEITGYFIDKDFSKDDNIVLYEQLKEELNRINENIMYKYKK